MTSPSSTRSRRLLAMGIGIALGLVLMEGSVRAFGLAREVGPSFTEWHPEEGVQLKRAWRGERHAPEFVMRFSTNGDRCRGPELPASYEHTVLCLGDSFTMGYGVDDGEEFPALLRAKLPAGWAVVNAGIGGQGNGRWLRFLAREGARLRPAVVVLQFCGNDYDDNLRERLYTLDAGGELVAHPPAAPSWLRSAQSWIDAVPGLRFSHLLGLGRQAAMPVAADVPSAASHARAGARPDRDLLHAIATRTVAAVRALGAVPLAVGCAMDPDDQRELAALLEGLGVTLLAIPTKEERPDLYYRIDGHWRAAGHGLAAERIWAELQRDCYRLPR